MTIRRSFLYLPALVSVIALTGLPYNASAESNKKDCSCFYVTYTNGKNCYQYSPTKTQKTLKECNDLSKQLTDALKNCAKSKKLDPNCFSKATCIWGDPLGLREICSSSYAKAAFDVILNNNEVYDFWSKNTPTKPSKK